MYFHYITKYDLPVCGRDQNNREGKMTQLKQRLNAPLKAIALASSAGLVLAGCASATEEPTTEPTETTSATAEPEPTSGGSMVVGITVDPDTIFPWKATQFQAFRMLENVYDTLTAFD